MWFHVGWLVGWLVDFFLLPQLPLPFLLELVRATGFFSYDHAQKQAAGHLNLEEVIHRPKAPDLRAASRATDSQPRL